MHSRFRYDDIDYFLGGEEPDKNGNIIKPDWNLNPELKASVLNRYAKESTSWIQSNVHIF